EGKAIADDRADAPLLDHATDRRADLTVETGLAHYVGSPPRAHDLRVSQQEPVDPHLRDRAAREAHHDQAAVLAQRAQAVGEAIAADGIEHDVDATAGPLLDLVLPALSEQHHLVGAGPPRHLP